MSTPRYNTHHDRTQEQWLKAEGITRLPPPIPKPKKALKPIEGQQELFEVDDSGKPVVHKDLSKRRKKKRNA